VVNYLNKKIKPIEEHIEKLETTIKSYEEIPVPAKYPLHWREKAYQTYYIDFRWDERIEKKKLDLIKCRTNIKHIKSELSKWNPD